MEVIKFVHTEKILSIGSMYIMNEIEGSRCLGNALEFKEFIGEIVIDE